MDLGSERMGLVPDYWSLLRVLLVGWISALNPKPKPNYRRLNTCLLRYPLQTSVSRL